MISLFTFFCTWLEPDENHSLPDFYLRVSFKMFIFFAGRFSWQERSSPFPLVIVCHQFPYITRALHRWRYCKLDPKCNNFSSTYYLFVGHTNRSISITLLPSKRPNKTRYFTMPLIKSVLIFHFCDVGVENLKTRYTDFIQICSSIYHALRTCNKIIS